MIYVVMECPQLESNLHPLAISTEWSRHVDSVVTVGSASHVVINSSRASSKHGIGRKRVRSSEPESNPSSKAASGLGIFWWRGGKLSRRVFNWKVVPCSLASKAARQGLHIVFSFLYAVGVIMFTVKSNE
jgi:hypothetical protein